MVVSEHKNDVTGTLERVVAFLKTISPAMQAASCSVCHLVGSCKFGSMYKFQVGTEIPISPFDAANKPFPDVQDIAKDRSKISLQDALASIHPQCPDPPSERIEKIFKLLMITNEKLVKLGV
jgi:hypothetical protein